MTQPDIQPNGSHVEVETPAPVIEAPVQLSSLNQPPETISTIQPLATSNPLPTTHDLELPSYIAEVSNNPTEPQLTGLAATLWNSDS